MKKLFIYAFAGLLTLAACKKAEKKPEKDIAETQTTETEININNGKADSLVTVSETKTINGKTVEEEYSYPYVGLDKTRAKATFINKKNEHTITIEANNQKFVLDKKGDTPTGSIYERNSVKAEVKGDSLFITQGNTIIPLYKAK